MNYDFSFIYYCKGRLKYLKQSLESTLNQYGDFKYKIFVVDYDCPDCTKDYLDSLNNPMIEVLKLENKPIFNASHSRNVGARYCGTPYFAFIDCETIIAPTTLESVLPSLYAGIANFIGNKGGNGITENREGMGIWFYTREAWELLRGYDESMEGWGVEDYDMFDRATKHLKRMVFPRHLSYNIRNTLEENTRFYKEKNRGISQIRNKRIRANVTREINPNGFGLI